MEEMNSSIRELPYVLASRRHRFAGSMLGLGIELIIIVAGAYVLAYAFPGNWVGTGGEVFQVVCVCILAMAWSIYTWTESQTPAHLILKMRVYSTDTWKPASWRLMALRCFLIPVAYNLIPRIVTKIGKSYFHNHALVILGSILSFSIDIVDGLWIFIGGSNQRLVDVLAHTVVLNECKPNTPESSERAELEGEQNSEGHEETLA